MRTLASWRLWAILALAILVALIYWPSTEVLCEQWSDFVNITFTHGWVILAVVIWLVWRARRDIESAPARPWPLAKLALLGAVLAWLVCYRASIQDLHITIFPAIFWLAVTAAFGWNVGRLLLFPMAFFGFALPSWAQLGNPLQELTIIAMHGFLGLTGPPALISGDVIHIPNGSFLIEEGCSGLHFMIVGLAVAALHGELRHDPWKIRLAQLALMAGLSLLANWVRVYVVIEAGYLSNMRNYLVSVSHYWFGWGVFAGALLVFFWLSTWLTSAPAGAARATPQVSGEPPMPRASRELTGVLVVVLLLAVLPAASALARRAHPPEPLSAEPFVVLKAPWSAWPPASDSLWYPFFAGADDTEYLQVQRGAGPSIEIFRVRFREQRQGAELVGGSSSLLGSRLRGRTESLRDTSVGAFRETEAIEPGGARSLLWWRYRIGERTFARPLASQLWYGIDATVWNPPSSLLALRTPCLEDCEAARSLLQDLVTSGALR